MEISDFQLLRAYHRHGDELAFSRLTQRHAGWIFATARRRLRDDHLADDATQAVFVVLATQGRRLIGSGQRSLAAWLFEVLHFACARALRSCARRARHETWAGLEGRTRESSTAEGDGELVGLLESTIARLPASDRDAVVRRFFLGENFTAIAHSLAISPEAAHKRVTRALAAIRQLLLQDGIEAIPDELIGKMKITADARAPLIRTGRRKRIDLLAKGTIAMAEQAKISEFPVVSAEFCVKDVETNIDFFQKLGFQPRWRETPDAMGRLPRASLVGGAGRIWLRRASDAEGSRPSPGVGLFFWINGGPQALTAHRSAIAAEAIQVSPFADDHTLRNFTVTTPDGYTIGFFPNYRD